MENNIHYERVTDLPSGFRIGEGSMRPWERAALMCPPDYFSIEAAINPHMLTNEGELQVVDPILARAQWQTLRQTLQQNGIRVEILASEPGLPDMVFTANQSFPFLDQRGRPSVLLSQMKSKERRDEVANFAAWYRRRGYRVVDFPFETGESLEGMGDLLWLPERRILFAGIGPRTSKSVVERLASVLSCPVLALELVDPRFYHLDTALALLDRRSALIHPGAFSNKSLALLKRVFGRLLVPPPQECEIGFACNALAIGQGRVILDSACPKTAKLLSDYSYEVICLDTSEFRKSGGSVFCMTMMLPEGP